MHTRYNTRRLNNNYDIASYNAHIYTNYHEREDHNLGRTNNHYWVASESTTGTRARYQPA